ncbi:MAG: hypothetical protein WC701_13455 [Kiritimatiellales bacterium]|jgi:hypothetical protein
MKHLFCKLIILCIATLFTSGCASIMHGSHQKIPVQSVPPGATVKTDGATLQTPCSVELGRKKIPTLLISKDGYQTEKVILTRRYSGWWWGNLPLGLILFSPIGLAVDEVGTGAAFVLEPEQISVKLEPLQPGETMAQVIATGPHPLPCIAKPDLFRPMNNTNRVRICVLRPGIIGSDVMKMLVIDGKKDPIGRTSAKTFLCWERNPGPVSVTTTEGDLRHTVNLQTIGGHTYFLLEKMAFGRASVSLDPVSETQAQQLLEKCNSIAPGDYIPVQ